MLSVSLIVPVVQAGLIIGSPDPDTGNGFPFGSAYSGEYQQVYTSSQFSGPITITNIEFFNTQLDLAATAMNSGNWAISLSTTPRNWNTLSSTFASNIGNDNTLVFNGNLAQPWAFGDTLTIQLNTAFMYNPSQGNLLMDVYATGISAPEGDIGFDYYKNGDTIMGRVFWEGDPLTGTVVALSGEGLVTGFNATVPLPPSALLFGPCFMGLAAIRRRFKT